MTDVQKEPRKPLKFDIPPNAEFTYCRGCNATIYWIITANSKRMPVDADGISHFATCSHPERFRKKR